MATKEENQRRVQEMLAKRNEAKGMPTIHTSAHKVLLTDTDDNSGPTDHEDCGASVQVIKDDDEEE